MKALTTDKQGSPSVEGQRQKHRQWLQEIQAIVDQYKLARLAEKALIKAADDFLVIIEGLAQQHHDGGCSRQPGQRVILTKHGKMFVRIDWGFITEGVPGGGGRRWRAAPRGEPPDRGHRGR